MDAGIYLIGYSAIAAVAAAIVNIASARGRIPFIYTLLVGCTVHTVGIGLLSTIATSRGFHATDIGYLVIAGTGLGLTMGVLVLSTPYIVEDKDLGMCSPEKLSDTKAITLTNWFITFCCSHCHWYRGPDPFPWWCYRSCYCV